MCLLSLVGTLCDRPGRMLQILGSQATGKRFVIRCSDHQNIIGNTWEIMAEAHNTGCRQTSPQAVDE